MPRFGLRPIGLLSAAFWQLLIACSICACDSFDGGFPSESVTECIVWVRAKPGGAPGIMNQDIRLSLGPSGLRQQGTDGTMRAPAQYCAHDTDSLCPCPSPVPGRGVPEQAPTLQAACVSAPSAPSKCSKSVTVHQSSTRKSKVEGLEGTVPHHDATPPTLPRAEQLSARHFVPATPPPCRLIAAW